MKYQLGNASKYISDRRLAIEFMAETLCGADFIYADNDHDPNFWDDIIEFCEKWDIPFSVDLFRQMKENGWQNSSRENDSTSAGWQPSSMDC